MVLRRTRKRPQDCDLDASIRTTDRDASHARLSAVRKRYLCDPFIAALVPQPNLVPNRPPLINIGTYVRSEAIDELVREWFKFASVGGKKTQIVSLGAGSDSRFWRIATGMLNQDRPLEASLARYVELDLSENTCLKIHNIRQRRELNSVIGEYSISGASLFSPIYTICDVDLRKFQTRLCDVLLSPAKYGCANLEEKNQEEKPLLDPSLPTLILAECVLVYMDQTQSDALINWFSDKFSVTGFIVYEMFGLDDNFGKVMKENLRNRNVSLLGVDAYPTLDAQSRRFLDHGFMSAYSLTLREIRNTCINPNELRRVAALELLDELEELDLVLDHYALAWAVKHDTPSPDANVVPRTWGLKQKVEMDSSRILR